ncbi:MAG: amidohydrolase family protein, partial [Synergistaceae bacterium]|nr:amidohydrolase family protein [Synergistaceae bacterium]
PVVPHLRILDAIYQDDTAFDDALAGGVTCVQTLPGSANIIGGQGAIIKTAVNREGRKRIVDEMVVRAPSSMKAALGENPIRVYKEKKKLPNTRMGNAALLRQAFVDAENYRVKAARAKDRGEAVERNLMHEAMLPVLEGDLPLCIHAHRCDDIATAVRIAGEFSASYTVEHCTEGHLIAPFLAERGVRAAVGPTLTGKPKVELRNKTWETPLALWKAGVHFCIITDHPVIPIEHLSVCLSLAVRAGLPREEALKAVTLYAAEHLGIQDRVGSVEPGKDADLAIWDGDPLDARTAVRFTIIDGETVYSA